MKIQLSKAEVEIVDNITWGQKERINSAFLIGVKYETNNEDIGFGDDAILHKKYKELEVCIQKITEDGNEVAFSTNWLDNLSIEDGDKLYEAVSQVVEPKKK